MCNMTVINNVVAVMIVHPTFSLPSSERRHRQMTLGPCWTVPLTRPTDESSSGQQTTRKILNGRNSFDLQEENAPLAETTAPWREMFDINTASAFRNCHQCNCKREGPRALWTALILIENWL